MDQSSSTPQQPIPEMPGGTSTVPRYSAMSPQWVVHFLKNYTNFSGRAGRTEYWSVFGWSIVVGIVSGIIIGIISLVSESLGTILNLAYNLVITIGTILPSVAVGIRRLHDTNKSGWFLLLGLIPIIGWIALFVFNLMPSDEGDNDYGVKP